MNQDKMNEYKDMGNNSKKIMHRTNMTMMKVDPTKVTVKMQEDRERLWGEKKRQKTS